MSSLTISIHIVTEVLANAVRQEKKIRSTQTEKEEVKLTFFFMHDMTVYVKDPKESERKLLESINDYR